MFGAIENFKNFDDFSCRPSQVSAHISQKFEEEKVQETSVKLERKTNILDESPNPSFNETISQSNDT